MLVRFLQFRFCNAEGVRDKLFNLSLLHSMNYGFNERAIQQACFDLEYSPASQSLIKPIELIHYSMRKWNREIIDRMTYDDKFKEFKISSQIKYLIKERLLQQGPYMNRWNEAMSLGAQHGQITSSILWQYADDCWFLAGDKSTDYNYYTKRMMFLYAYISTEVFMLTDKSPEFFMTWDFLDRRLQDVHQMGSYAQLIKNMSQTLWTSGYYMSTMFRNFPPQNNNKNGM